MTRAPFARPISWRALGAWFGRTTLAAATLVVVAHLVFYAPRNRARPDRFVFEMASSRSGFAQLYFDRGHGFSEPESARTRVQQSETFIEYGFDLPEGTHRQFRFDFLDRAATVRIRHVRVERADGSLVYPFSPDELLPNGEIASHVRDGDALMVTTRDDARDPWFSVTPPLPIRVEMEPRKALGADALRALGMVAVLVAAAAGVASLRARAPTPFAAAKAWRTQFARSRPRVVIALAALFATAASCYPVVFLGRSFASSNLGVPMLYDDAPSMPGLAAEAPVNVHGADIGAMLWQNWPYSAIERRALFKDHEFPLWNRYNSCGTPLLGQGQSMIGDPLHLLTLALGASAGAWDVKFLIARFVFCFGAGWIAFAVTRRPGVSCTVALAAAFVGFFNFRLNHPAIFSECYAPWILVCWIEIVNATTPRARTRWLAGWFAVNIAVIASGTVKEASMLIASLNLVGAALLVFDGKPGRAKWRMLGVMSLGAAALVLTTAPLWMSFLHDLSASFRLSEQESVWQIPRSWLLGFFDDMFLQQPFDDRRLVAPSMNLVFFLGTAWFLVHFRSLRRDTTSLLSITGALVALVIAFRWMPAAWILAVPGLRLVGHVHNTFAGVAVVLLLAPSSSGLALAWDQLRTARARARFGIVCFIALTLLGIYFADVLPAWTQHPESPTVTKVVAERGYFFLSVALVALCLPLLLALARSHARDGWSAASTFFGIAIGVALLARHGMHVRVPHDDAFLNITARPQADARSPAVEWLQTNAHAPARVLGTNGNLFAGASALYGIEGVNGPDALVPRAYRELVRASGWDDPRDWHFPTTVDAIARQHRLLDMLNVRYFVSAPGDPPPLAGLEARADLDLSIFENPTAWPRAFFTTRVARGDSADDVIRQLRDGDGKPFAAIDVDQKVSFPEGDHADASEPASEATDFALTANTTTFTIESPSRGIAVVTEGGSPDDFRATVDGQPAPVLRVNHAFKGVLIDSTGRHRIKLVYWPRPLAVSLWLAAAGVVLLGTSLWCAHALTRAATGTRKQAEAGA